jgi:hypothetical protein
VTAETSVSPYPVFISHSGIDTWVARQIAREIAASGGQPFLAELDVPVGAAYEHELRRALNEAREIVVLLTPWAIDRAYVWGELGVAWGRGVPIVGLLHGLSISKLHARHGAPIFLKERNLLALNDVDRYFGQLRARTQATPEETRDDV